MGPPSLRLHSLLNADSGSAREVSMLPQNPPRARRVISLFMHGGPSQLDLWDYKPQLREQHGRELPESVRGTQRLTGMTSGQAAFPVAASAFRFAQHGSCGMWVSELLPKLAACR
ncbi:MAG UNVERIFIED_CONTAM: DUF1501 domain-containing protein [Planctomycetaceae bacterium]